VDGFGLTQNCHCGHDKSSHYVDRAVGTGAAPSTCLQRGCECCRYVNDRDPKPPKGVYIGRPKTWPGLGV
jgi:hypothetical protein